MLNSKRVWKSHSVCFRTNSLNVMKENGVNSSPHPSPRSPALCLHLVAHLPLHHHSGESHRRNCRMKAALFAVFSSLGTKKRTAWSRWTMSLRGASGRWLSFLILKGLLCIPHSPSTSGWIALHVCQNVAISTERECPRRGKFFKKWA